MSSAEIKSLFSLLAEASDDFPMLMNKYGIDPSLDLRGCDFGGVDFGDLTVATLDLTGCNLDGANLSSVRAKIITQGACITARTRLPSLLRSRRRSPLPVDELRSRAMLAIDRYYQADWKLRSIRENVREDLSPLIVIYDSSPEQDYLTKQICTVFRPRAGILSPISIGYGISNEGPLELIWLYTRTGKPFAMEATGAALDSYFFRMFESSDPNLDVMHSARNPGRLRRIQEATLGSIEPEKKRFQFAAALKKEIGKEFPTVMLFSGYPPVSKSFYEIIRNHLPRRSKLIFLCPHDVELALSDKQKLWRRIGFRATMLTERPASNEDVKAIDRRIKMATGDRAYIGAETQSLLQDRIGGPLRNLKALLLFQVSQSDVEGGGVVI